MARVQDRTDRLVTSYRSPKTRGKVGARIKRIPRKETESRDYTETTYFEGAIVIQIGWNYSAAPLGPGLALVHARKWLRMNILLLQSHASLPGNEFIRRWYIASRRIRIYRGPLVSTFLSFHIYFSFSPFLFPSFFLLPLSMLYFFAHLRRSSPHSSIIRSVEPQDYSFDRDSARIYRGWIEIKKEHPVNSWSTSRIASRGGCSLFHGLVRLAGLWNQVFLEGKSLRIIW